MKKRQSTIAKLPEDNAAKNPVKRNEGRGDINREALLEVVKRGGKPALGRPPEGRRTSRISVRLDSGLPARISEAAKAREVPISSNQWIIEAVFAQLKRESK